MSKNSFALAYARVSTMQQADLDLSIPAQLKAIRDYATSKGITILNEYVDEGVSAYHDNHRPQFDLIISEAISNSSVSSILVHDSTRFSRNKYNSGAIKATLRKHGVSVVPVSSPYDPTTIDGIWRESIDETLAMTSSMQTAFHVMKGMKENALKKDPSTGYYYKNGGNPPYGYKTVHVVTGKDNRGKDILKALWEPDPTTAPILHTIIVDWRIGEGLSYKAIRDRLNSQGIPSPGGNLWSTSTIVYMLKEDRLLQYAGTYLWNKSPRRLPGKSHNDRSEWIEVKNAHPPIITMEQAQLALNISQNRQPRTASARSYDSRWLLTGNNLEGNPFFSCQSCGGNMIGVQFARPRGIGKYVCGNLHYKGKAACSNAQKINQPYLETTIISLIEKNFSSVQSIEKLVDELNSRLDRELAKYNTSIIELEKQIRKVKQDIDNTFDAYSKGLDPDLCNERLSNLKNQRLELEQKLYEAKKDQPQKIRISPQQALNVISNFKDIVYYHLIEPAL